MLRFPTFTCGAVSEGSVECTGMRLKEEDGCSNIGEQDGYVRNNEVENCRVKRWQEQC